MCSGNSGGGGGSSLSSAAASFLTPWFLDAKGRKKKRKREQIDQ
jgi:hypothetical protein